LPIYRLISEQYVPFVRTAQIIHFLLLLSYNLINHNLTQKSMDAAKIDVVTAIKTSISWGIKNIISLIGAVLLWVLTIWIPYLNVGTTIAMLTIPIELSKGNTITPTFIFDAKYRKYMGEFFILNGIRSMAITIGFAFFIIPGIVMSIAYSMSNLLLLDKEMDPMQTLTKSNKLTYGNKWRMFFSQFALILALFIVITIFGFIPFLGAVLQVIAIILVSPILLSLQAYFYKTLVLDVE